MASNSEFDLQVWANQDGEANKQKKNQAIN